MKKLNAHITYEELLEEGRQFLAHCGVPTLQEHTEQGMEYGKTSANEILGMGTRVLAEVALQIQTMADEEERNGSHTT